LGGLKMLKKNFFIFVSHQNNFDICLRRLVYGANLSNSAHRALANVKKGDILFLYNMDSRSLYGPFLASGRVFKVEGDIGWRTPDGRVAGWPHKIPFEPWSYQIGVLDKYSLQRMYSEIHHNLLTIRDLDDLHRRYLNTLLIEEGELFFEKFLEHAKFMSPNRLFPNFGAEPLRETSNEATPLNARELLGNHRQIREYIVELYLLQNLEVLESIVGRDISEVYNQLYVYQNRYLDILTVHRHNEKVLKATVIELKSSSRPEDIIKGIEELGHYMYTLTKWLGKGNANKIFGILLTPINTRNRNNNWESINWESIINEISELYSLNPNRITWVKYEVNTENRTINFSS